MSMCERLKELHLLKNKKCIIILVIELLVLIWVICGLFGKDDVYEFSRENMNAYFGEYSEALGGHLGDSTQGAGCMVEFPGIFLPEGHYVVYLEYDTDVDYSNTCGVVVQAGYKGLLTNGTNLHAALETTNFEMWLMRDVHNIIIQANCNAGTLLVKGLTIVETNALNRIYLFTLICVLFVINTVLVMRQYDERFGIRKETKAAIFGVGVITALASVSVMVDCILSTGDMGYHLNRIEGLKDGILSGQFPVRIAPKWLEGNGYADPIFYPSTMLLPAALLRIIGFTVTTSYQIYMCLVNFMTAFIAYYCFSRMFKNVYLGLSCSLLHTLSLYRIFNTYTKGSLGEALAIMFLPLIVYGFYRVFTEDIKAKEYKWSFIPLTIGFCGIIQSHMLTCELVGGFTILLCIVLWKKVLRKETFWVLAKTVIWSALICGWFIVPFLDYMLTGNFGIHNVTANTIQERGLYIAHFFNVIPFAGSNTMFGQRGMRDTANVGIGFALMTILLTWLYIWFTEGRKCEEQGLLEKKEYGFAKVASIFAILAMIMSLNIFPWDWIQSKHSILATLISSLQFPTRVLTIANVLLVALAGVVGKYILHMNKESIKVAFFCCVAGLTIVTSCLTLSHHLTSVGFSRVYNPEGMGFGYIAGAEYLPYGTDQKLVVFRNPTSDEEVVIEGYEKGALRVEVGCYNSSDREGTLVMPLLYYKGYQAYDMSTNEKMEVFDGENHSVCVKIPANYSGVVVAKFVSPWYWRVAEAVTVLSVVGFVLLYRRDKKKGIIA